MSPWSIYLINLQLFGKQSSNECYHLVGASSEKWLKLCIFKLFWNQFENTSINLISWQSLPLKTHLWFLNNAYYAHTQRLHICSTSFEGQMKHICKDNAYSLLVICRNLGTIIIFSCESTSKKLCVTWTTQEVVLCSIVYSLPVEVLLLFQLIVTGMIRNTVDFTDNLSRI